MPGDSGCIKRHREKEEICLKLQFITSNMHKFNEISAYLKESGIECQWVKRTYEEIQAETTEEVSLDSAKKLSWEIKQKFFLEDTGLYIESLKGFPGPYSSYVFKTIGNQGILNLLLNKERAAYFLTVISYFNGKEILTFTGKQQGTISMEERGRTGFGYDPIFIPSGCEKTLGEMSIGEKNKHSHRIKALENFIDSVEIED